MSHPHPNNFSPHNYVRGEVFHDDHELSLSAWLTSEYIYYDVISCDQNEKSRGDEMSGEYVCQW